MWQSLLWRTWTDKPQRLRSNAFAFFEYTKTAPDHVLASEQAVANVTRNPCKPSPSPQACQQFPGVLASVCAASTLACARTRRFWLLRWPSYVQEANNQHRQVRAHETCAGVPNAGPSPQQTAVCCWRACDPLCDQALPAITVKPSLPGQWQPSCSQSHLSACNQERKLQLHDVIIPSEARASLTLAWTSTKAYPQADLGGVENSDCYSPPMAFPGTSVVM